MEEKKFDFSKLYIVDFVKNLTHKKNIFAVIYLLLNVIIISMIVNVYAENFWLSLLYGIVIYGITATIALSPLGEWAFRFFNGCKKIQDPAILNRLEPLFMEVKAQAQRAHPDFIIDERISLYICDDDSVNAFAMGRRTVCVTQGLLQLSDEQIKGVLGHEFGHLATHDTDLTLLITVGNFLISAFVTMIRVGLVIFNVIVSVVSIFAGDDAAIIRLFNALASLIATVFINGMMWVWTQLGILLVMKSSRDAEYEADAFSCDLGYSDGLLSFFRILQRLEDGGEQKDRNNIFAALSSSHPDTDMRIARIEGRTQLAIRDKRI